MKSLWKSKRKHRRNQRNSLAMHSGQISVFRFRFGWKLIELTESQGSEGRLNLNFQARPYGVAFLNP